MGKPWARYEIGFINHDKFRAIPGNAICLWLEGKNYADTKHTDGLLPSYEAKHWRFFSKKNVDLLTASVGQKPGTDQSYAPLWEAHVLGWKMHDYLDHNDCRDVVLARITKSDAERQLRAENQKAYRDRKKREYEASRDDNADHNADCHATDNALSTLVSRDAPTTTQPQTEAKETNPKTKTSPPKSSAVGPLPGFQRLRVFGWMANRFVDALGSTEFDVEGWLLSLERDSTLVVPVDDKERWTWLQHAFDFELKQRGLLQSSDPDAELRALAAKGPSVRHQVRR